MRELAVITRIQDIKPIPDKDRIELATAENYPVIVEKGKYSVGDLVVYVFYDTILPIRPEFEFLRSRCYSELYEGFRIQNMKMAGVYSSGIIFDLSILPKETHIQEGKNISTVLGIRKYDPEEKREQQQGKSNFTLFQKWMRKHCKWYRRYKSNTNKSKYPDTVQKSDEENVEKLFNTYKQRYKNHLFYTSEKMEGQAAAYMLLGWRRKFKIYSRNMERDQKGNGAWETLARNLNIKEKLKKLKINYCIQGEICGPGIQGNIYKFDKLRLFVYKITETKKGKQVNLKEVQDICNKLGLDTVPILEYKILPSTVEEMIKGADGYSVYGKKVKREGVVWRSTKDQHISCKAKSRDYAVGYEKKNKTE